ncbi:MAG: hypothetical protein GW942_00590 [Candidatus Pacebacteria bacterium]|nr:hypothetical protein [Candidatus Paceibacterota bacterium]
MIDLTARQVQILRAVIEEFITTAQPVGSETVDKKYRIGVSPATIRNEMVHLTKQGYLQKGHTSSGRQPTSLAMRLYVNELMKEKDLSVADEVSAKEKIWKNKDILEDLLVESSAVLAEKSRAVGIALTGDKRLYTAGYSNLLNMPEFYDINVIRHVLSLIEEVSLLEEVFDLGHSENPIQLVFGPDLGNKYLDPIAVLYMNVNAGGLPCKIGVLGSARFEYDYIIPLMKYLGGLIEEMTAQ